MTDRIKRALTEASIDTMIALPLNFFINWIILAIAFDLEWDAFKTSIVATIIFTATAIVRKTIIRLKFERRTNEKSV